MCIVDVAYTICVRNESLLFKWDNFFHKGNVKLKIACTLKHKPFVHSGANAEIKGKTKRESEIEFTIDGKY